jgi:hypothetical protein
MSIYTWRDWREVKDSRELENLREFTGYAIQSQYSASPKILALAEGLQSRLSPEADVDLFYRTMFDIHTAEGVGLDNWGVILGIGRGIPGPSLEDCFGFDETQFLPDDDSGPRFHPFNQLPFVPDNASSQSATLLRLPDDLFRLLLLYKALANISPCDAAAQNRLLSVLIATGIAEFGGKAYVLQTAPMVIRWVFEFSLSALQLAVFKVAGTLARGAGVGWELYAIDPRQAFGFAGGDWQPFNQAPFAGSGWVLP